MYSKGLQHDVSGLLTNFAQLVISTDYRKFNTGVLERTSLRNFKGVFF